jgi:hypothetical protein
MSSSWNILRKDIVIATLATTDVDMAATQTENAGFQDSKPVTGASSWAAPQVKQERVGEYASEYEIMVLAYNGNQATGTIVSGTFTVQFVERADYPALGGVTYPNRKLYAGRPAVTLQPTGVPLPERGCYFQRAQVLPIPLLQK